MSMGSAGACSSTPETPSAQPSVPEAAARRSVGGRSVFSCETDGVDHHVLFLGALHHVLQRVVRVAEIHRTVHAVGEYEDDAPALLVQESGNPDVHRIPQGCRSLLLELGAEDLEQFVVI